MGNIIKETWRSFQKGLFFNIILIAQLAVCFWLFSMLLNNFVDMGHNDLNEEMIIDENIYHYASTSVAGDTSPAFLKDLEAFSQDLRAQTAFTFMKFDLTGETAMRMDVWNNQVHDKDYKLQGSDPRPSNGNGNTSKSENSDAQTPPAQGNPSGASESSLYINIKGNYLDYNSFQHFPLQYIEGHGLDQKEDFVYHKGQTTISIVLGYQYRNDFQVGDSIPLQVYSLPVEGKVVGILAEHSYTFMNSASLADMDYVYLDDYILLPYLEFDYWAEESNPEEYMTQINLLKNSINGHLMAPKDSDPLEIARIYRGICDRHNMTRFGINISAQTTGMRMFAGENQRSIQVILVLVIIMGVFCLFILVTNMMAKIDRNIRTYMIQMMNGASIGHIITQYLLEILLVVLPACVISGFLLKREILFSYQFLVLIISLSLLCAGISAVIVAWKLKNLKTDELLRRKE